MFEVNQKIVCVRDDWTSDRTEILPKKGETYTIREITNFGFVALRLKEIVNPGRQYEEMFGEVTFDASHFRPLIDDHIEEICEKVEYEVQHEPECV